MSTPYLIVMSGLPGSGKSTIAERIAQRLKIPILSVDPIESAIIKAGIARSFETGVAAYLVAQSLAGEQLKLGNPVIIDAVNAEEEGKDTWRSLAQHYDVDMIILDVFMSDQALHQQRVESRVRDLHGVSEVTWDRVEARRKVFTPWVEPTLRLDATNDVDSNAEEALRYIQKRTVRPAQPR